MKIKVDLDLVQALDLIVTMNLIQVPEAQALVLMMITLTLDQVAADPTQMNLAVTPTLMNQAVTPTVMMKVVQMKNLMLRANRCSHLHHFNK